MNDEVAPTSIWGTPNGARRAVARYPDPYLEEPAKQAVQEARRPLGGNHSRLRPVEAAPLYHHMSATLTPEAMWMLNELLPVAGPSKVQILEAGVRLLHRALVRRG